jgi:acyl carrier protein
MSTVALSIEELRQLVFAKTALVAGLEPSEIGPDTTLESAGLDSSEAVIVAMEIEETIGIELDPGVFLRFANLGEVAEELARLLNTGNRE